ncbi:hypothetical protein [Allorhodopirellula heiligendammensis]|uniref:Secreted protein n=1 Tax=Allorhodopirellula heiligendammensis TaxID=2714739 RepID=A0A5C6BGC3_9BACT|nr:hypothetical protein [Allorhodopirellula heiligendammensis]TWU10752.1 hypothetical protein Poly21_46580 [Allorhodopirellula heiligendammensis]
MLLQRMLCVFCAGFLLAATQVGCGPDNSATVSPVDDSVVHSPEEMEDMSKQNASDMNSK